MILETVKKYLKPEEIVLITSNYGGGQSSDIDIYCITTAKSAIYLFSNKDSVWIELFIDNIEDVYNKINNIDEIAINFIREMDFVYGDKSLFEALRTRTEKIVSNYKIPERRKNIIKYRIKVLFSKYLSCDRNKNETQRKFIINSLSYPLIQLVLEYYNIFPSSPKKWIIQLKKRIPRRDFLDIQRLISGDAGKNLIIRLYDKYVGKLGNIKLDKSKDNNLTFLS
ncbi:MAG: hypothetical protein WCO10_02900 [bacterium]